MALPKLTVPGPEYLVQVVVTVAGGFGRPSSLTVPFRLAAAGSVMVSLAPASTAGAVFVGVPPPVVTVNTGGVALSPEAIDQKSFAL